MSGELYTNLDSAVKLLFESLAQNAWQAKAIETWNILKQTSKELL